MPPASPNRSPDSRISRLSIDEMQPSGGMPMWMAERSTASPSIQGGLADPWEAIGPIVAAPGDQPHAVAITLDANAETVLLDLVKPLRPGGNLGSLGRNSKVKRFKHALKIGSA
jgi:hypothetical protein